MKHRAGQWLITVDNCADTTAKPATNENAVGLIGPRGATLDAAGITCNASSKAFRLRDDDGTILYEGHCYLPEGFTLDAFRPLDDFGTPNACATVIEYKNDGGDWEAL